ncbi:NAD(P)/FAD-dependent oxidoreductase [Sabulicella glaciei]|uniref:FAD-dependent oxidoreductase n=1 Tax=Sabulicella glaciei TaxID=2984948 RepID=A0ABT3NSY9_9PROT|nr:FAD-dependent oxidoreductase [Roseococcus sp. MDT2-1-1]MCW8085270.1 FAD-dependent oxidoreductase [Roseococcus sp. MDT2-1-1]
MTRTVTPGWVVIVGGGFAGVWAAMGAAHALNRFGASGSVEVTLVNPSSFHVVRVRCYEADLDPIRVPLDRVLAPIGVKRLDGAVSAIDTQRRAVALRSSCGIGELRYDRLILAAGSALQRPAIPGFAEHSFDVDSYDGAARLERHIAALAGTGADAAGRWTAVVIGAGLVGLEIACELPARLKEARDRAGKAGQLVRVLLLDRAAEAGAGMGQAAATPLRAALKAAGVETRGGTTVAAVYAGGVELGSGERIAAETILCATGTRASPLAAALGVPLDGLGRVSVDACLRAEGVEGIFAAGDIASAAADDAGHRTVMSCQHARPMGRVAGYNAVCELLGREEERVAFSAPDYVTVLDLGPWGAVYTSGWDRAELVASGARAKAIKHEINSRRIYPPLDDRGAILEAGAPRVQPAPRSGTREYGGGKRLRAMSGDDAGARGATLHVDSSP